MRLISGMRSVRQQPYLGWIISFAALGSCLILRVAIEGYSECLTAISLMPAVMIAALFGGLADGIVTFALASVILFFFFVPPRLTFEIERSSDVVGLAFFIGTGFLALYLIEALNSAVDVAHKLAEQASLMQQRTSVLFAELQHRVANNLTFLTAVLDQKARQFDKDGPVGCVLTAVKDRLMAMSLSHRRLYDPQRVNEPIGQYLAELCSEQISASGLPVTHSIGCDPVVLGLDQLVPVALIVSELITNCLKHAFKDRTDGHITIRLQRCGSGQEAELSIADNGRGISASPTGNGLGQKIVAGLAAQLNADLRFESAAGTTAVLRFPLRG